MARDSGMMFSIIDNRMGSYPSECVERFVILALTCCHDKPEHRPSMLDVVRELENILKMFPETDSMFSQSELTSMLSGKSASTSSSFITRDPYVSSNVSGSDLISGVIPSISPRWHQDNKLRPCTIINMRNVAWILYLYLIYYHVNEANKFYKGWKIFLCLLWFFRSTVT